MVKRGLGRGLGALLPAQEEGGFLTELDVEAIVSSEYQPRQAFSDDQLDELAESIREHGVIQPIIVEPVGEAKYRIVAGERRWRACKKVGITRIPAIIRQLENQERAVLALVENLQRQDLSPLEEAGAYARLIEEFGLTQEEVARKVGKSRPVITNALRLLQLPLEVQQLLRQEKITSGHARALLAVSDERDLSNLARRVAEEKLTVRETEKLVRRWLNRTGQKVPSEKKNVLLDHEMEDLVTRLQDRFGTKVNLRQEKSGGRIEIYYYNTQELYRLIEELLNISSAL